MNAHMKGYRGEPVADAAGWRFELGEFVTHKDQSLPSLVKGRVRTTKDARFTTCAHSPSWIPVGIA